MGRRSRYERKEIRVTEEWFKRFCEPRLTDRDREIFRFLNIYRIATSEQLARKFFPGQKICNRRLRKLFDLHCIDRFFPPVETGSALQHVVLDYAGAKAINIDIRKINELPSTFFHTILVTEFVVEFPGDLEVEKDFGVVRPDLYYPGMAIEIDTGTEGYRVLKEKARRYNRYNFDWIIFVTAGNPDRIKTFFKNIRSARHKAGATFKDLKKLIKKIQEMA